MNEKRFVWEMNPIANPENVIKGDKYRFTVLNDRLIRLEYSECGIFEDRASQSVFFRNFGKTDFVCKKENGIVTIETEYLKLKYAENSEFKNDTLVISIKNSVFADWHFGDDTDNLGGTVSTLDKTNGSIPLENGVCSKKGISVIDDSKTMLLNENGWVEPRKAETIDMYFFGFGHSYLDAIKSLYKLTGAPSFLPAYALGNWWSRYYRYTQEEYLALMERFKTENLPFSVAVIDMDWHTTTIPEDKRHSNPVLHNGWTGYSWNKELFPDYVAFLDELHTKYNMKTSLNLHPALGIRMHEDMYEKAAIAMGLNPEDKQPIYFDILSPKFMEVYFDEVHHPYENNGVDFWWMDWQQGTDYYWIHEPNNDGKLKDEREVLDPLWMLNHLHTLDIARSGKRPMYFSRYCGPGSHRYSIGFSGDTCTTWAALEFQPYFTSTASNIGYCWWSHDIGGHTTGYRDDELQVRWLQLGVLSPINRLHCCNNAFMGKEPWNLTDSARNAVNDWLKLRHRLFPYLYTMNYRTQKDLEPLIQPMYYKYPENTEAYSYKNQYWFGSECFVAPITEKSDSASMMGAVNVWLPKGLWFDLFSGIAYSGDCETKVYRNLKEYPIFAKAGAIIPTEVFSDDNTLGNKTDLEINVFAGDSNNFTLYEDTGEGYGYKNGDYVTTDFSLEWNKNATFTINPAKGNKSIIPEKRNWNILLRGFAKKSDIAVSVNGKSFMAERVYDEMSNTIKILIENISIEDKIVVNITYENELISNNETPKKRIFDLLLHAQMDYTIKSRLWKAVETNEEYLYLACSSNEYSNVLSAVEELNKL